MVGVAVRITAVATIVAFWASGVVAVNIFGGTATPQAMEVGDLIEGTL